MSLEIVVAAGFDTPEKLARFCLMEPDEQARIYEAAAKESKNVIWVCEMPKKGKKGERHVNQYHDRRNS